MQTCRGLAVSEEHQELAASAGAVLADGNAIGAARLEGGWRVSGQIRTQIAERVLGTPRD
jgi:hypothetical protein